ncbi:uncharacterized protein G2W53_027245 [Senna tora]|uniref:Uncharacterized protein n=1 Tax=Senna tora TaxID=362788 RepID=A0A834THA7_9FABA|nr:uncharacterized protein G2W53_027245 [Senna tora]
MLRCSPISRTLERSKYWIKLGGLLKIVRLALLCPPLFARASAHEFASRYKCWSFYCLNDVKKDLKIVGCSLK